MGTSQVGSIFTYKYHTNTNKLWAEDGSQDNFTNYFNGNLNEEAKNTLNGFDAKRKHDLETLMEIFAPNSCLIQNLIGNENEFEVTCECVDAATKVYSVNGTKVLTAYDAMPFSYVNLNDVLKNRQPYKTHQPQEYNPEQNSIHIAVGDKINFENGYILTVEKDHISVEGYENETYNEKLNRLILGLDTLIRFADQQCPAASLKLQQDSVPMLLRLLGEMGVDTSREFIINGTKCEVVNGEIREADNTHVIPSSAYQKALKHYEEMCLKPLSSRKKS